MTKAEFKDALFIWQLLEIIATFISSKIYQLT